MDDLLYNALSKYFAKLANFGYSDDVEIKKILFYCFINELVNTPSIVITQEEYTELEKALYCIYGTTCLIPYPNYCENAIFSHLGKREIEGDPEDMRDQIEADILARVESLERDVSALKDLDIVLEVDPT